MLEKNDDTMEFPKPSTPYISTLNANYLPPVNSNTKQPACDFPPTPPLAPTRQGWLAGHFLS